MKKTWCILYCTRSFRVSKNPPTAKRNVFEGMRVFILLLGCRGGVKDSLDMVLSNKACYARHFAYCTNRSLTYHQYADGPGLLVLAASLTSGSLSKTTFLTKRGLLFLQQTPFLCN